VDAVSEIVERAQKELVIEKQLKKVDETWAGAYTRPLLSST
jgi:dynein heavy chain